MHKLVEGVMTEVVPKEKPAKVKKKPRLIKKKYIFALLLIIFVVCVIGIFFHNTKRNNSSVSQEKKLNCSQIIREAQDLYVIRKNKDALNKLSSNQACEGSGVSEKYEMTPMDVFTFKAVKAKVLYSEGDKEGAKLIAKEALSTKKSIPKAQKIPDDISNGLSIDANRIMQGTYYEFR